MSCLSRQQHLHHLIHLNYPTDTTLPNSIHQMSITLNMNWNITFTIEIPKVMQQFI